MFVDMISQECGWKEFFFFFQTKFCRTFSLSLSDKAYEHSLWTGGGKKHSGMSFFMTLHITTCRHFTDIEAHTLE